MVNAWMQWLTKYKNKKCYAHSDMHSMATLFNNHLYISSGKFSANWRATATYVGMVFECGRVMECISLCA